MRTPTHDRGKHTKSINKNQCYHSLKNFGQLLLNFLLIFHAATTRYQILAKKVQTCFSQPFSLRLFTVAHTLIHSCRPGIDEVSDVTQNFFWPGRLKWSVTSKKATLKARLPKTENQGLLRRTTRAIEWTRNNAVHDKKQWPRNTAAFSQQLKEHTLCTLNWRIFSQQKIIRFKKPGIQTPINVLERCITSKGKHQMSVRDNSCLLKSDSKKIDLGTLKNTWTTNKLHNLG